MKKFVLGDCLLDRYYYGKVSRVSPEAPIPVVNISEIKHTLGGAANVAANIIDMGNEVVLCGFIGSDDDGALFNSSVQEIGIESALITSTEKTIVKARVVGNNQQITRLDFYDTPTYDEADYEALKQVIQKSVFLCDAAIISDYNKGVCRTDVCHLLIQLCNERGIPVIVDPKGLNWDKYCKADIIKPNLSEFYDICTVLPKAGHNGGISFSNTDECIEKYISKISERYLINSVVVTRSEKGMSLYTDGIIRHFATEAKSVFDVSGAGDTAVATIACELAKGSDIETAIKIANIASGIAVGKVGTSTVTSEELDTAISSLEIDRNISKIYNSKSLTETILKQRNSGKSIVFTNGCFDLFHRGHAVLIQKAASFGDFLIVAINSDESVKRLKGKERPLNKDEDRAYVIAALEDVDAVTIFEEDTPEKLLKVIKPDVIVKGGDYTEETVVGREYADRVEIVQLVDGYSTTKIIQKRNGVDDSEF